MSFFKRIKRIFKNSKSFKDQDNSSSTSTKKIIYPILHKNLQEIKNAVGNSTDVITREIYGGKAQNVKLGIIYTDGLADTKAIRDLIESLLLHIKEIEGNSIATLLKDILDSLKEHVITIGGIKEINDFETLYTSVLSGDTVILIDGYTKALVVSTRGWEDRGVTEATNETNIRGPREAFTETLRTNTALIRRKIKSSNLWLETKQIGRVTKTDVAIMYIKGIANDNIVEEVHRRINRIDVDSILESGYIEEFIQDEQYSPFPTIYYTERPDVVSAALLEGRIAILVDGTPEVLLVPVVFFQFLQTSEDYYQRADIGSFLRILRFVAFFIGLLGPSLYIAITTFHQEMLPTQLLLSLIAQREGVPFPAFVEALLMELTFEILREAGVRLPRSVGQAVSIVGALVIGQAAVEAGIVSAAMVIVVAVTAISSFASPAYNLAISIRMLRFIFMCLAASFGLYGILIGLIAMNLHLASLRSFGIPYISPLAPFNLADQKDMILRFPRWSMRTRPRLFSQKNKNRMSNTIKNPKPRQ